MTFKLNKLWISISSVASGILTSVLSEYFINMLFPSDYERVIKNGKEYYIQIQNTSNSSFLFVLFFVLLIFAVIWMLMIIAIYLFPKFFSRIILRQRKKISVQELINQYNLLKKRFIDIEFNARDNIILMSSDLYSVIDSLYTLFCPEDKQKKDTVIACFRTGSTLHDFDTRISPYEFKSLIKKIEELNNLTADAYNNELFNKDFIEMQNMISELLKVVE